eukprot:TRINITY_DN7804_c2_g1_i2.p1 TRINITY_DN7804_c2_g1~~TRINITY_DN7804_c2_g1_i2.p1  ORF type:complete len:319 (+),score=79.82 TRINITY_DN7804_c2_g1_i2:341-1297(+)
MAKDPLENSLYSKLGLSLTATLEDVKSAYKREALRTHPDRCNGKTDAFQEIQEAYEVLKDVNARKSYNRTLSSGVGKKKDRKVVHLTPFNAVKQPMVVDCRDGKRRTFDVHDSAFKMPLRHGDQIETNRGEIGVIVGMFDCFVYWWKGGDKEAVCLGDREELMNPGFGGLKYKKITAAAKAQAAQTGVRRGRVFRSSSAPRPMVRKTSVKKQPAGSGERRKFLTEEQNARTKLQKTLWEEHQKLIMRCQSDIDVLIYKQKRERNRAHALSQTHQPPSPRIRRHTSGVFTTPRAPTPSYNKSPKKNAAAQRLPEEAYPP